MRIEPRWLDAAATADYISVRVADLPRLVKAGSIPAPAYQLGPKQPRWDRLALDSSFAGQAASGGIQQAADLIAQGIQQGR